MAEYSSDGRVEASVRPTADSVDRGVLPCLKSIVMAEIVGGFPKVEHFVTVLNWTVEGGDHMADQEDIECRNGR